MSWETKAKLYLKIYKWPWDENSRIKESCLAKCSICKILAFCSFMTTMGLIIGSVSCILSATSNNHL